LSAGRRALGARGERLAAQWYERNGYEVLDRNWRCRDGELDIVARCGGIIIFSEVKTRSSNAYGSPAEAVGIAKQRRIRRLAMQWMRAHGTRATDLRFDVVSVVGNNIEVLQSAF
jgi:putative endonuclease